MENLVNERLKTFIASQSMSVRAFERRCGLKQGYVRNVTQNLGAEKLDGILREFPRLSREWLLYGSGDMLLPDASSSASSASGHGTSVAGDDNSINSSDVLLRAFDEIAASRRLVENTHELLVQRDGLLAKRDEQIDRLLTLLEKAQGV